VVEFIPAEVEHARDLGRRLRADDLAEIRAVHGFEVDPVLLLRMALDVTDRPLCAVADGLPIALLGCAPGGTLLTPFGVPWLLGSDESARHPRVFVEAGRRLTREWLTRHGGTLLNRVDARNLASIRWLRRIGFEIHKPAPYGAEGRAFHPFTMCA
jgi:hypothetical protein